MSDSHEHAGPNFNTYMMVFGALCVCTALSFAIHFILGHGLASASLIMIVSVIKATLVAAIFMHLMFDWKKLYCVILPVCIVTLMMVIILSIDATLVWHVAPDSIVPYPGE